MNRRLLRALCLACAGCFALGYATHAALAHRAERRASAAPARPFLDEMADVNAEHAALWEGRRAGLAPGELPAVRAAWRAEYDGAVRASYLRHGKALPPHLRGE